MIWQFFVNCTQPTAESPLVSYIFYMYKNSIGFFLACNAIFHRWSYSTEWEGMRDFWKFGADVSEVCLLLLEIQSDIGHLSTIHHKMKLFWWVNCQLTNDKYTYACTFFNVFIDLCFFIIYVCVHPLMWVKLHVFNISSSCCLLRRVLVMEYMDGIPIMNLGDEIAKRGINPRGKIAAAAKQ